MTKFLSLKKEYIGYGAVLLFGLLMSVMAANAASTISTNISTGGTLTVDTTSTLTGAVTMSASATVGTTFAVSGASTLASTTATTFKIGQSGTATTLALNGTCALLGANLAVAATTTQAFDCTVAAAVAGDRVFVSLATTTPTTNEGWKLHGANASSTSGYITILLTNLTGGTVSPAAGGNAGANSWASTTQYWIVR